MPRKAKPPRLWLRRARVDDATKAIVARAEWIILDRGRHIGTGCTGEETIEAERQLANYISGKHQPSRRERDIEAIYISDVLSIYDDDARERQSNKEKFDERIQRLNKWWGQKTLAEIDGDSCRAYRIHRQTAFKVEHARRQKKKPVAQRAEAREGAGSGGARRDLEDLRAAVNHHARRGYHRGVVFVELPEKGEARDVWLTRSDAARLLWACWRAREKQKRHKGSDKGKTLPTAKYPLRHLARFILCGLYTGSRAATIAAASPKKLEGRSWVDLERGIFYRRQGGKKETKKRQPTAPLPPHLLAHMRRWVAKGIAVEYFVEWGGKPINSVKTALASAVRIAGVEQHVTPHTLRHTAATWLMQNGVDKWEAAGFLGMSLATLERVYGHHHPDHMKAAARGFRPKRNS